MIRPSARSPWLVALAGGVAGVLVATTLMPADRVAATTALSEESFAVCTAPIDGAVEGFFILDFETGDLTGGVLNQSTSKFGVSYRHNVLKDLGFRAGKVKNPKFLLVPGLASFAGAGAARMAQSVLYVTDAATGVTVAYGIPWNSQPTAGAGGAMLAELVPLDIARPRGGGAKVQ